jgi:formate hydrogenlyase subunit 6/NADH:ubiquinone oxidoreductase subunit I
MILLHKCITCLLCADLTTTLTVTLTRLIKWVIINEKFKDKKLIKRGEKTYERPDEYHVI